MVSSFMVTMAYFALKFGLSSGIVLNHNDTFLTARRMGPGRKR
jgi:hypothetical protein